MPLVVDGSVVVDIPANLPDFFSKYPHFKVGALMKGPKSVILTGLNPILPRAFEFFILVKSVQAQT